MLARLEHSRLAIEPRVGIDMQRAAVIDIIADHQRWLRAVVRQPKPITIGCWRFPSVQGPGAAEGVAAAIQYKLGLIAYDRREFGAGRGEHFQEIACTPTGGRDRANLPGTYHWLARVAARQQDPDRTRQYYRQAIELHGSRGNRLSQSRVLM